MNEMTRELVQSYGPMRSRELYVWADSGTVEAYPQGKRDNTHLNVEGATKVARMAAGEIGKMVPELGKALK